MELLHKKQIYIDLGRSDKTGKLSLLSLLNELQTIAGEHADILHFGIQDLNKNNDTWVLSRLRVEIDKWPRAGETVLLKTWPKGIDRLFAIRDFMLYDEKGEILVRAASYWLIVDRLTKRPKIPAHTFRDRIYPDLSAIDKKPDKIPAPEDILYKATVITTDKEVDVNGHINNVWYAHWIMSALPEKILTENNISCFGINYIAEVFANETLEVSVGTAGNNSDLLLGSIKRDGKEVCRVKMEGIAIEQTTK